MNVLCIWDVPQNLRDYFTQFLPEDINMIYPNPANEENFCKLAKTHEVEMIVGWRPTAELLAASPRLRFVQNPGAGVQHLTALFAQFPDVALANCHGNAYFTAQHAVAILMTLTNTVIQHHHFMQEGLWRNNMGTRENIPLRHNRIGILGLGHVGSQIAQFLSGFDVELIACKRSNLDDDYPNITKVFGQDDLAGFFSYCDIVIVTLPLTADTKQLIGKRELDLLGSDGLLVNMGRGEIIVEEALFHALQNGTIKGAALDVWWNERVKSLNGEKVYPYSLPFHTLDNIVMSPHRAASPMSDLKRWDPVIQNIIHLKTGQALNSLGNIKSGY